MNTLPLHCSFLAFRTVSVVQTLFTAQKTAVETFTDVRSSDLTARHLSLLGFRLAGDFLRDALNWLTTPRQCAADLLMTVSVFHTEPK